MTGFGSLGSASCNQASVISLVLCVCSYYDSHGPWSGGNNGDVFSLSRDRPRNLKLRSQFTHHNIPAEKRRLHHHIRTRRWTPEKRKELKVVPEDLGTVIVVLHRVLHKTETVDIAHVGVSIGPQKVKAAHCLLQRQQMRTWFILHDKKPENCNTPKVSTAHTLNARQTLRATSFSMADSMTG